MILATGSIVNFGLNQLDGVKGLRGWQWMFIVQGVATCSIGIVTYWWMVDFPEKSYRSFHFLTKIPWTPVMKGIPEIAYGHHEKLDGSGYPRGLTAAQIPLQARMMTICDIYDALTAQDRPYKRAVPIRAALDILHSEADGGKLDRDLLGVFIDQKIYHLTAPR